MRARTPKIDRPFRRAALFGLLAVALTACAAQQPSAVSRPSAPAAPREAAGTGGPVDMSRPVTVALLAPLSGLNTAEQAAAADVEAAARLAAADGGIDLRVYDTQANLAPAADAARRAIAEGAAILIGPFYRETTTAVRPVAETAGVPVLSFSSDKNVGGGPVWVLGDLPGNEVDRVVAYAASQGIGSLAVVRPQSEFGELVNREAARAASRHGVALVESVSYPRSREGVQDATAEGAPRILASGAGAVLIVDDSGPVTRELGTYVGYNDILQPRVRWLGLSQWSTPGIAVEPVFRGGWFAAPDPVGLADFEQRFVAATGRKPNPLASRGYDAVRAIAAMLSAARASGSDRPFTREAITDPRGFRGARGAFRLTPDGANRRALAILEVGDREFIVRDPAPAIAPAGS